MKVNWRYILIVMVIASVVAGGTLWWAEKDFSSIGPFELNKPEKKEREVVDGVVIIKEMNKELIWEKIETGKEFLYRMEHPTEHGFYKKYDAPDDFLVPRLHTVYSASIIYTFLYLYDLEEDEEILSRLPDWGEFLLSMQNKDKDSPRHGAFHYSYYFEQGEKEQKFVSGTAALSIFTLLRLHKFTGEEKYLESAKLAGDWLIAMQEPDGSMKPYVRYNGEAWVSGQKESLLYNGQCLSALSKLYSATGEEKYFEAAEGIAQRYAEKYEAEQGYIEGDYREKNPISNAWVVMSLMDFYRAKPDYYYKDIVFELSREILKHQKDNPEDIMYYGRWQGAYSTSGNGWLSEVMTDTYRFCLEQGRSDCGQYKEAVIKVIRWVMQHTYSKENSFSLENPERAEGGIFWDRDTKYVRTDSVCHALNGYARILPYLDDGVLISIE